MVYCGKPSKGCSNCRERKIRCDQKEPGCGQCDKRQQKCPGYRNLVDLMFRDESNHVIKKATKTRGRGRRPKPAPEQPTDPDAGFPSAVGIGSTFLGLSTFSASNHASSSAVESVDDDYDSSTGPSSTALLASGPSSLAHRFRPPRPPPSALFHALATATRPNRRRLARRQSFDAEADDPGYNSSSDDEAPSHIADAGARVMLRYMPSRSLQEQGTAIFFSRYVATDSGCYENYNFIYDVWRPPSPNQKATVANDCVTASMTAVGLACLSKLTRSKDTMLVARQTYGAALSLTNKALRDPVQVVEDKTFLAVLILGTYEFVAGQSPQTVRAWQEHVNGAAALARLRGAAQFRSTAGTKMFLMLCHSLLISCIEMDLPMPHAMVELRKELGQLIKSDTFTWQVVDAIYKGLQIRYDIKIGKLVDLDETIQRLSDVEQEFDILVRRLPRWWRYRRGELVSPHEAVMGRTCHLYSTFTLATTWNGMRTIRLLIQETIIDKLCSSTKSIMSLSARYQLQLAKAVKLQQLLGEAVVASVPQHFGVVSFRDIVHNDVSESPAAIVARKQAYHLIGSNLCGGSRETSSSPATPSMRPTLLDPTQSKTGQECDAERFMTLATASHTIIWPLYTLGLCSATTTEMKQYAIGRLDAIWYETGLDQARTVAELVRNRFEEPLWERISIANLPELPAGSLATVF
ncbi:hypothetical protein B0I35DRAFT_479982 [Stachybotrys elegans]|uniref:Zn(2)-C6 fungal-type domain-containing protein n=1 Tax=Stachybotrys elegans TaxID=80388 RepID=A0A8K0SKL7_9HYPO|nr:hypothetical protein B0I35DRAFT_479982 [Stachybotrys elegans]